MTASQQPDAEHVPLTSPAAGGSGSTGHDKAVLLVADAMEQSSLLDDAHAVLAALRAALAAGDDVAAEALGVPSLIAAALRDAAEEYDAQANPWGGYVLNWFRQRADWTDAP